VNVCVIPAKGSSLRIPHKNRRPFHGRPIICYSIDTARESGLFEKIVVSTDDPAIARIATDNGADFWMRPARLSYGHIGPTDVTRYTLRALDYAAGFACCVLATSPLMLAEDLRRGLHTMLATGAPYAYSAALKPQREDNLRWDAGQWYWGAISAFLGGVPIDSPDAVKVVIPAERVCDINEPSDWELAEVMYAQTHGMGPAALIRPTPWRTIAPPKVQKAS